MLVLLSSMGFYVDHMVCGMSGEHKVAINQAIDSCSDSCDREEENTVKRTCCDYDSYYFKDEIPATNSERTVKPIVSAFRFVLLSDLFPVFKTEQTQAFLLVPEPDILPSVERHILIQTFLI